MYITASNASGGSVVSGAAGVLRCLLNLKRVYFCEICCHQFSTQQRSNRFPGRRPTRITGRFSTVTRGWVKARNERAAFISNCAVVGSVDRCLSTTRNLAASNQHLDELFPCRLYPNIFLGIVFVRFFFYPSGLFLQYFCSGT